MKTAMQELIDCLKSIHMVIPTNTKENRRAKGAYVDALQKAKSLLAKERKQIEASYKAGSQTLVDDDSFTDYFTQTYNTPKP